MAHSIKPGVATGNEVQEIFQFAKEHGFALPAVNVIGSNTINAVMETAAALKAPVIIQFSNGGAQFNAGKGLSNENQRALASHRRLVNHYPNANLSSWRIYDTKGI